MEIDRCHISIHSPYTGRDYENDDVRFSFDISIHSPYTGRDRRRMLLDKIKRIFQSTLPIQGETKTISNFSLIVIISIHSPYTGRDRREW